jgi:hypothetical protein
MTDTYKCIRFVDGINSTVYKYSLFRDEPYIWRDIVKTYAKFICSVRGPEYPRVCPPEGLTSMAFHACELGLNRAEILNELDSDIFLDVVRFEKLLSDLSSNPNLASWNEAAVVGTEIKNKLRTAIVENYRDRIDEIYEEGVEEYENDKMPSEDMAGIPRRGD